MPRFKRPDARHDAALVSSYLRQLQSASKPPAEPPKQPAVTKAPAVPAVSASRP